MKILIAIEAIGALTLLSQSGCSGTYDYRHRVDGSEVAVVRSIADTWSVFAKEVKVALDRLDVKSLQGTLGKAELQNKVMRLSQEKDQVSAQIQDFITARYQSYINAELDQNPSLRQKGREEWNRALEKIQLVAFEIRQKGLRLNAEAKNVAEAHAALKHAEYTRIASADYVKNEMKQGANYTTPATEELEDALSRHPLIQGSQASENFWREKLRKSTAVFYSDLDLADAVRSILTSKE